MPRVHLASPNQTAHLRLEPRAGEEPWWRVLHAAGRAGPAWSATFDARTPVEAIAGFLDALTDPDPRPSRTHPLTPLRDAGWTAQAVQYGLVSPDGTAYVQQPDDDGPWHVTTTTDGHPLWRAQFTAHTPTRLISGFVTALADTAPVMRTSGPWQPPRYAQDLVTHTRRELPVTQVAGALEDRVRALAARREAPPPAPAGGPPRPNHPRR
jgi:hypothetical protein